MLQAAPSSPELDTFRSGFDFLDNWWSAASATKFRWTVDICSWQLIFYLFVCYLHMRVWELIVYTLVEFHTCMYNIYMRKHWVFALVEPHIKNYMRKHCFFFFSFFFTSSINYWIIIGAWIQILFEVVNVVQLMNVLLYGFLRALPQPSVLFVWCELLVWIWLLMLPVLMNFVSFFLFFLVLGEGY